VRRPRRRPPISATHQCQFVLRIVRPTAKRSIRRRQDDAWKRVTLAYERHADFPVRVREAGPPSGLAPPEQISRMHCASLMLLTAGTEVSPRPWAPFGDWAMMRSVMLGFCPDGLASRNDPLLKVDRR
jgi:hypothetical protein